MLNWKLIIMIFNVIFSEKQLIGESGDFLWIFVFVWEESGLDCGLRFGLCDG